MIILKKLTYLALFFDVLNVPGRIMVMFIHLSKNYNILRI